MMSRYRAIHAPILSFFSFDFYRDVARHWTGTGFAYLLLLLAVCWIPLLVQYHLSILRDVHNKAPAIISQMPEIRIVNGEVSANVTQPYKITDPSDGSVLAIIDTTGQTASLEGETARVLLTASSVSFRKSDLETRTFSLRTVEDFTLNQDKAKKWCDLLCRYGAIALYLFVVIGSFAYRVVQSLCYAAIGSLFARWCKASIPYLTLVRLSVMAVTPVIILSTILDIPGVKVPYEPLWYFTAAMIYLFLEVRAVSRIEESHITPNMTVNGDHT